MSAGESDRHGSGRTLPIVLIGKGEAMHRCSGGASGRALVILSAALPLLWALPALAVPGEILGSFDAPGDTPGDLAWDGLHLWLLDSGAAKVYQIDPASGSIEDEIALGVTSPRAIACEEGYLWVSGERDQLLVRMDLAQRRTDRTLPAPRLGESDERAELGGLTWGGGTLWCGQLAGWSSRIQQVDPVTGQVLRWFFSTGYPVAVETDGRRLWTATPTVRGDVARIFQHDLATEDYQTQFNGPGQHPVGLAFDGRDLWCVDAGLRRIFRLAVQ